MMWGVSTKERRRPTTLGRAFARSTGPLLGFAGFALAFLAFSTFWPEAQTTPPVGREVSEPAEPVAARVAELVRVHGCWTGAAPADMAGRVPGHVVVTPAGAVWPRLGGDAMVGRALEHVFEGRHSELTVHAFCR